MNNIIQKKREMKIEAKRRRKNGNNKKKLRKQNTHLHFYQSDNIKCSKVEIRENQTRNKMMQQWCVRCREMTPRMMQTEADLESISCGIAPVEMGKDRQIQLKA